MDRHCEIEKLAYELYERSWYVCGNDMDHWLEAERIVCSGIMSAAKPKKAAVRKSSPVTAKAAKTAKTVSAAEKKTSAGKSRPVARSKKTSPEKRAEL